MPDPASADGCLQGCGTLILMVVGAVIMLFSSCFEACEESGEGIGQSLCPETALEAAREEGYQNAIDCVQESGLRACW